MMIMYQLLIMHVFCWQAIHLNTVNFIVVGFVVLVVVFLAFFGGLFWLWFVCLI